MPKSLSSFRILLTAAEAYPELERAFLAAESEIWGSFLVFDLSTRLRSEEAQAIGKTWFDLVLHTLNRGVAINITISDVDPVARAALHRAATRQHRLFSAAAGIANPGVRLTVTRRHHPAETGAVLRLLLWPYIMSKVFRTAGWLNSLSPPLRSAALRDMTGAARNLHVRPDGTVRPRLLSLPRLFPAVHHQKLAVIDRKRLYIGGLDLDERRYDTPTHGRPGDETWHDVQLLLEGPVVAEAQQHLETFHQVINREVAPARTRRLLRTMSRPTPRGWFSFGPDPLLHELWTGHKVLVRRATGLIYLESQYFRDIALANAVADQARRKPDLQMILILPAAPDDVAFDGRRGLDARFGEAMQARALRILRKAFGARLFVGSPAQPRPSLPDGRGDQIDRRNRLHGAPLIYVHAKVSIFDDQAAIVSSANLNGRSFRWDTEAGVYLSSENDVRELRHRVMTHWLPKDAPAEAFEAASATRFWARLAWKNAAKPPADRQGFLLPHNFAAAEAFGKTLPLLPPEFV